MAADFFHSVEKEIIKKRTVMLVLVFVLSLNTLTGCGKKTKEESKSRKAQTELPFFALNGATALTLRTRIISDFRVFSERFIFFQEAKCELKMYL